MPLPIIPNTYRVAFIHRESVGITPTNVMHFVTTRNAADLLGGLDANSVPFLFAGVSSTFPVVTLEATKLDGGSGSVQRDVSGNTDFAGGAGGDYIPASSYILSFQTASRGRSFRGRMFPGPVPESQQSNGLVNDATRVQMQTAWNDYITALRADSPLIDPVVASYRLNQVNSIVHTLCRSSMGTQRRRQHFAA